MPRKKNVVAVDEFLFRGKFEQEKQRLRQQQREAQIRKRLKQRQREQLQQRRSWSLKKITMSETAGNTTNTSPSSTTPNSPIMSSSSSQRLRVSSSSSSQLAEDAFEQHQLDDLDEEKEAVVDPSIFGQGELSIYEVTKTSVSLQ